MGITQDTVYKFQRFLDDATRNAPRDVYREVLEEIVAECEARLDCLREEDESRRAMIDPRIEALFDKMLARGDVRVHVDQLPDLEAAGITRAMLIERGVKICDEDDPSEVDYVICVSAQRFYAADNVYTVCADCGGAIQHRPNAPAARKICIPCAEHREENESAEQ